MFLPSSLSSIFIFVTQDEVSFFFPGSWNSLTVRIQSFLFCRPNSHRVIWTPSKLRVTKGLVKRTSQPRCRQMSALRGTLHYVLLCGPFNPRGTNTFVAMHSRTKLKCKMYVFAFLARKSMKTSLIIHYDVHHAS